MSKNTRNRILLTAVAALLLVAVTVGGTMAYLQATSGPVVNTFTPSDISVELTEEGAVDGEQSFQFIPSQHLDKEPVVSAESNVDYYVFVEVTVENWPVFKDDQGKEIVDKAGKKLIEYTINTTDWSVLEGYTDPSNTGSGTVVLYKQLKAGALADTAVLSAVYGNGDEIYVSSELTKEQMATIKANPTMTFNSYAAQQINGDTTFSAKEAWTTILGK